MLGGRHGSEPLKKKVVEWLIDEGLEVSSGDVPQGAPLEWVIKATMKAPIRVSIVVQQPKGKKDRIDMILGVAISDFHKRRLTELKPIQRAKLINALLVDLVCACPDCFIVVQPRIDNPQGVLVSRPLQGSHINRETLGEAIRVMANIYLLIVAKFNSELGSPDIGSERGSGGYYTSI